MKTYIIILILALTCSINLQAENLQPQPKSKENISKDTFRKKQKEFIIREAQLNPKEANYFFPLYFELQDKKQIITNDANAKQRKALRGKLDEKQYKSAVDQILNAHVKLEQLEREYVEKYRKVLSNKKIFRIMMAENKFRKQLIKNTRQ